jgi:hypothetical protein
MRKVWWVALLVMLLLAGGLVGQALWADTEDSGEVVAKEKAPIVQVLVSESETEYDHDPFEVDRLRSSNTYVEEILIVRADGSWETKSIRY